MPWQLTRKLVLMLPQIQLMQCLDVHGSTLSDFSRSANAYRYHRLQQFMAHAISLSPHGSGAHVTTF